MLILARGSPATTASTAPTTTTITIITTTVPAPTASASPSETSTSGFRRRSIRVLVRLLADGGRLLRMISVRCIIAAFATLRAGEPRHTCSITARPRGSRARSSWSMRGATAAAGLREHRWDPLVLQAALALRARLVVGRQLAGQQDVGAVATRGHSQEAKVR